MELFFSFQLDPESLSDSRRISNNPDFFLYYSVNSLQTRIENSKSTRSIGTWQSFTKFLSNENFNYNYKSVVDQIDDELNEPELWLVIISAFSIRFANRFSLLD